MHELQQLNRVGEGMNEYLDTADIQISCRILQFVTKVTQSAVICIWMRIFHSKLARFSSFVCPCAPHFP